MKSIKANFEKIQKCEPILGSYSCLAMAVKGKGFTTQTISRFFTKIMPLGDYDKNDRPLLVKHLALLSNPLVDDRIEAK
ncbi:hypothetical protein K9M47_01350 [Candidatus Gracilibacteria bacterium]|nr:hypothetical protein [Candidatus Gracilibacteria bacterium]MCF7899015.1 hypothetical protein [Candidatus Paceibacterota bacterium]